MKRTSIQVDISLLVFILYLYSGSHNIYVDFTTILWITAPSPSVDSKHKVYIYEFKILGICCLCRCERVRRINDEMTGSSQH